MPDIRPDFFCATRGGRWIYSDSPEDSFACTDFEVLAQEVFRVFARAEGICSWAPARTVTIADHEVAAYVRRKASQTTRALDLNTFELKAEIWPSNAVLALVSTQLRELGFVTEVEATDHLSFTMPFLDDLCGPKGIERLRDRSDIRPRVNLDAYHPSLKLALQVEAGQALENKNYLRNFFESIVLSPDSTSASVSYLGIALCRKRVTASRSGKATINDDFPAVAKRLYALFRSLEPPHLHGFFIVSY